MVGLDVYQREDELFDWRWFAPNGEQQGESHQGFGSKTDAHRGFVDFVNNILTALMAKVEDEIRIAEQIDAGNAEELDEALSDG